MVMMEPLLLILVFMVYDHHSLRHCLTSVSQTLTPSPILAMHLSPFCFGLRLRKSKSILLLLMFVVLTLSYFAFQWMAWLVLKLLAILRDLLLDCHRNRRGATLKFCTGFVSRLAFAILRTTGLCAKGTRSKWVWRMVPVSLTVCVFVYFCFVFVWKCSVGLSYLV